MTELDEATRYLKKLTDATNAGRMLWQSVNPTTFIWETDSPTPARIVVQQVSRTERTTSGVKGVKHYVFQLSEGRTGQLRLSLSSMNDTILRGPLGELYAVASGGVTRAGLDFLKTVVPK